MVKYIDLAQQFWKEYYDKYDDRQELLKNIAIVVRRTCKRLEEKQMDNYILELNLMSYFDDLIEYIEGQNES